ncbi:MAG: DUF2971 domain-containing protein [Rhodospirillales bacterium]
MTDNNEKFYRCFPELYHYTGWEGAKGIIESGSMWASHYSGLNDRSEVQHMKKPLKHALPGSESDRQRAVDWLYGQTFDGFATPYITSFSTHADLSPTDRENGLIWQWVGQPSNKSGGYGRQGYALVFDTRRLDELLDIEFKTWRYLQVTLAKVFYNHGEDAIRKSIKPLVSKAVRFFGNLSLQDITEGKEFVSNFITATATFKHACWSNEKEVRIITCPYKQEDLQSIQEDDPEEIKKLKNRSVKTILKRPDGRRYIALFSTLSAELPITRIIVAPDENQDTLFRQMHDFVGGKIPIRRSSLALPNAA